MSRCRVILDLQHLDQLIEDFRGGLAGVLDRTVGGGPVTASLSSEQRCRCRHEYIEIFSARMLDHWISRHLMAPPSRHRIGGLRSAGNRRPPEQNHPRHSHPRPSARLESDRGLPTLALAFGAGSELNRPGENTTVSPTHRRQRLPTSGDHSFAVLGERAGMLTCRCRACR